MSHPERDWLEDILDAAREIRGVAAGLTRDEFEAERYRVLAVERLLEIIGEAAKQVSTEFRTGHPEIPWKRMAGMRDLLIHAYRNVDPDEVWKAVSVAVPELISALEPLLPNDDDLTDEQAQ
ncbi:MAG TPA: DUF86 domain-containing protein [Longimicrobium sp.]|nr:DUF86 domain-containing protein [Longimicrobium sp.]